MYLQLPTYQTTYTDLHMIKTNNRQQRRGLLQDAIILIVQSTSHSSSLYTWYLYIASNKTQHNNIISKGDAPPSNRYPVLTESELLHCRSSSMGPRVSRRQPPEAETLDPKDYLRGDAPSWSVQSERSSPTSRGADALFRPQEIRTAGGYCGTQ